MVCFRGTTRSRWHPGIGPSEQTDNRNNGEIVEKRYSTEPSWLDRYRLDSNKEEPAEGNAEEVEVDLADMHS